MCYFQNLVLSFIYRVIIPGEVLQIMSFLYDIDIANNINVERIGNLEAI